MLITFLASIKKVLQKIIEMVNLKKRKGSAKYDTLENGPVFNSEESDIRGDEMNIAILLLLYTLQGIPLGLASAIPIILQNKGISYTEQAKFSLVSWPFSVKLLWAPIVDALFLPKFGRRKTWLVPCQYLIGIVMLISSLQANEWLGSDMVVPSMGMLAGAFMILNTLAATQDIAVDGWALTMLKSCNVGHASTCNTIGQTAGFFFGYIVFVALESVKFCNTYLRSEPQDVGIVTLSGFLQFWGWTFIVVTTLVALFKHEVLVSDDLKVKGTSDVKNAYVQLYAILKLPAVRTLAFVVLTCKIGFAACDAVSALKLVEAGVPREDLAMLAIPLIPVQILLPLALSKHTTGEKPLKPFLKTFPMRLWVGPVAAILVYFTPSLISPESGPSYYYLTFLVALYIFHQACLYTMFVSLLGFYARVSDPLVGGTYMTLLNTVTNMGTNWPSTLSLWAVDRLTFKACTASNITENTCANDLEKEECLGAGGSCVTTMDGFYIETAICLVLGFLWLQWGRPRIQRLQRLDYTKWRLPRSKELKR